MSCVLAPNDKVKATKSAFFILFDLQYFKGKEINILF